MHYEDDPFHPNNIDEDDFEYHYEPSVRSEETFPTSVNLKKNLRKNAMDPLKMVDKGYHKLAFHLKTGKKEVEVYASPTNPGFKIRDAITGARYQEYKTGSKYEDLFFKAIVVCGHQNKDGLTLFFDSPEQYERHMHATISQKDKEKWTNKCANARNFLNKE